MWHTFKHRLLTNGTQRTVTNDNYLSLMGITQWHYRGGPSFHPVGATSGKQHFALCDQQGVSKGIIVIALQPTTQQPAQNRLLEDIARAMGLRLEPLPEGGSFPAVNFVLGFGVSGVEEYGTACYKMPFHPVHMLTDISLKVQTWESLKKIIATHLKG